MSRPKSFKALKPETVAVLPEVPKALLPPAEVPSELNLLHLGNIDHAFKSPVDRRLAYLALCIRSTPPWLTVDEWDYSCSDLEIDRLERLLSKAFWVAFRCGDEGFFEQLSYIAKCWKEDDEGFVPSDLRFRVSAYYDGWQEVPNATQLLEYVNWTLKMEGRRPTTIQHVVDIAKRWGFLVRPGDTGMKKRKREGDE